MEVKITNENRQLFSDIITIIEKGKNEVARTVNATITSTYWHVGNRLKHNILMSQRADYGKEIIKNLSKELTQLIGKGWSPQQLRHCIKFAEVFTDVEKVSALRRQLSWTHIKTLIYLPDENALTFYTHLTVAEKWSTRKLQQKIDSMLFERTAISKKPDELAKLEITNAENTPQITLDLVFKDHYILDFLDLKDAYLERDLEEAILHDIENFILELGEGFTFVERQKRMTIDNTDFALDLLFFHRKLRRLVAIELKLGKFKPAYKGQMELYLRWLEKNESESWEEQPIGLILCAEGNQEQVELLQLDKSNIRVAEYITEHLPKELLEKKLHQFSQKAAKLIEQRKSNT